MAGAVREERKLQYHISNLVLLFLIVVLILFGYTYVLQKNYADSTLNAAVERNIRCADAIHVLVSNKFEREDFTTINSVADMELSRYKELQASLNELRTLNSTRYLYTASKNEKGQPIYLVDGLDLGAEDFAYPGTLIEEEMVPYIETALAGETTYSQNIMDTTWGHIFTACYPIEAHDGSGEIIGALCMEMDMEDTYAFLSASNKATVTAAVCMILLVIAISFCAYFIFQSQRREDEKKQRQLEAAAQAADTANKAKSTFLFNISHDIRTPMNAIIGYAELTKKHLMEPEKLAEYVEHISTCGQRMLSMLDNILEVARIENDKIVIEESVTKAGDGIDSCAVMVDLALKKKNQTLKIQKDIRHPYVYLDTSRVTEVVLNILGNAIKYTGEGGTITCSVKQKPYPVEGWCMMEISIADTGIGMSEEFQKHIFESFTRERSSTVSGVEGTGLGMGIVKKLVDLMDGTIEVHSKLGEGSTFIVSIPCRIARGEDAQPKSVIDEAALQSLKGRRVLLAEDNDLNAEIAIELLSETGLLVDRAENGVECIQLLEKEKEGHYDLILMDIQMPVLNGYQTTQKIRKLPDPARANIPVIAMTANAFAKDKEKCLQAGMNGYVAKPIDMNILIPEMLHFL